jgi:hypothetical protein
MNPLTKATAQLLKACLKNNYPYAIWKVTSHRGLTIDMINVEFNGEADINEVTEFVNTWTKDDLAIRVSGKSYQLI